MKFKNRLYIFLNSYLLFVLVLFFFGSLWGLLAPLVALVYLVLGGLIHA